MRPRTQKQPQVKKELCRALDDVDVDVGESIRLPLTCPVFDSGLDATCNLNVLVLSQLRGDFP